MLPGRGGRGTSSTLTAEVIFPAPGSGLARHSLPLPRLPERLSFCFFPLWGAFVSSRPERTRGRCLSGCLNCILSRQQLLAEESDEYRAVEQVVPEMEIGKPVVSSSEVSLARKWAFPPNQPALIQTYRMPRERSLELPGEGWDRKDLVSIPVQLGENKSHHD